MPLFFGIVPVPLKATAGLGNFLAATIHCHDCKKSLHTKNILQFECTSDQYHHAIRLEAE